MKKNLMTMIATLALITFASCSNDTATNTTSEIRRQLELDTTGLTQFAIEQDTLPTNAKSSHTTGKYTGSALDFFWTFNDNLWINRASNLTKSKLSDIPINGEVATARFWFEGSYTENTYPVRYTGNGNPLPNKVTIKEIQGQSVPNDGTHIGTDGDCGTAIATRSGNRYLFSLDHKASYLTFSPNYSKQELAPSVAIVSIKVSADEDMAGTYDFDDNGLNTNTVTNGSKSITLNLTNQFTIPQYTTDPTKNAAIMVIAPRTYNNFTVTYELFDSETNTRGTISKNYGTVTCTVGRNKPIKFDFPMENYSMKYYMWDAGRDYWDTYTGALPVIDREAAPFNGQGTNRYFNDNASQLYAVNACKVCPNVNEATLFAFRGEPYWDGDLLWTKNKHLYKGGMWFLKLAYINSGYTSPVEQYPDNTDYRNNIHWQNWVENDDATHKWQATWTNKNIVKGKPSNTNQRFFLPAMGYVDNQPGNEGILKTTDSGYYGAYWTSTSVVINGNRRMAIALQFSDTEVGIDCDARYWSYPLFRISDYSVVK